MLARLIWCVALIAALQAAASLQVLRHTHDRRQATSRAQHRIAALSVHDPIAAAEQVLNIRRINDTSAPLWGVGAVAAAESDYDQVSWSRSAPFHQPPAAEGNLITGYTHIPDKFHGFTLNRSRVDSRGSHVATAPVYMSTVEDPSKVKRIVLALTTMPRDAWKTATMLGNAYEIAKRYDDLSVQNGSVAIAVPVFFSTADVSAGAARASDLSFKKSNWMAGAPARTPAGFGHVSSYSIVDTVMDDMLATYTNAEHVVVIGHSMGARATLGYAVANGDKHKHRDILSYWVGNPGSYTWLTGDRPYSTHGCADYDRWPSGLGSNLPHYAKERMGGSSAAKHARGLRNVRMHLSLGLNDNGNQGSRCVVEAQGANRLARGSQWILMLRNMFGGLPKNITALYVPEVSHQDYVMFAQLSTLRYVFGNQMD
ncbi:hypothetical protein MSPP1_004071 [Malassezia sp. CBS 17886]|nr:hypothetical protein MSPP1_004071 [Malassezia sp. CBS 17886]